MELPSSSLQPMNLGDTDGFTGLLGLPLEQGHSLEDLGTKRRSRSQSIKRHRFDDELVESSLGTPGGLGPKVAHLRTQSTSSPAYEPGVTSNMASTSQVLTPKIMPKNRQRRSTNKPSTSSGHRSRRPRYSHSVLTKDLGRWKPTDDLSLIIGVQQTNDLLMVHRGIKFSSRFTVQEVQQRWCALLYDPAVSYIAVEAMRNLPPEHIRSVQSRALFSEAEEQLLSTIKSTAQPTLEIFQEMLAKNTHILYPSRTAKSLMLHWLLMKLYSVLPDMTVQPLPRGEHDLNFTDAEEMINDDKLMDLHDEAQERDWALADRESREEIRYLENELGRWQALVDTVTGIRPTEFDNQTLAVLRGRLVRYLLRSKEIIVGRSNRDYEVDIDLSLEGPAWKVSRRQGTIRLRNDGVFFMSNEGKRAFYIDGRAILAGNKYRLNNNSVLEIAGLRFVFLINQDLISVICQEVAKLNLQP